MLTLANKGVKANVQCFAKFLVTAVLTEGIENLCNNRYNSKCQTLASQTLACLAPVARQ